MAYFGPLRNASCPEGEEPGVPVLCRNFVFIGVNGTVLSRYFGDIAMISLVRLPYITIPMLGSELTPTGYVTEVSERLHYYCRTSSDL